VSLLTVLIFYCTTYRLHGIPPWRELVHFHLLNDTGEFADGRKFEDLSKVLIYIYILCIQGMDLIYIPGPHIHLPSHPNPSELTWGVSSPTNIAKLSWTWFIFLPHGTNWWNYRCCSHRTSQIQGTHQCGCQLTQFLLNESEGISYKAMNEGKSWDFQRCTRISTPFGISWRRVRHVTITPSQTKKQMDPSRNTTATTLTSKMLRLR